MVLVLSSRRLARRLVLALRAPLLQQAGHDVYSPSLTGLGERKHLARLEIDLDTHIGDIVSILEMEDLRDVVLVGHSYGGMVITGAADRAHERIRRLVYLDAFVPENGKCMLDYVVPERAARMREEGETHGQRYAAAAFALGADEAGAHRLRRAARSAASLSDNGAADQA